MGNWWIVLLPGEDASDSEPFGPFRSRDAAQAIADKWNRDHVCDDSECWKYHPEVMSIRPAREIPDPTRY